MKQEVTAKKVFIRTLGCQMNVRDSEVICGLLLKDGYELVENPEDADVLVFNTCSVRQHAEDKVWSEIGMICKRGMRDEGRRTKKIIGLIGCMANNYGQDIFKRAPEVDFVVGTADIAKIPQILAKALKKQSCQADGGLFESKILETEGDIRPEEIYHTDFYKDKHHAYVVISEGCSNFCSYCVVPYVRGGLRHRESRDILKEIEEAVDNGITKITLLGQNVNAYKIQRHKDTKTPYGFVDLIRAVNEIKGIGEFSFITSHPKDIQGDLFGTMAGLEKLKKYLHLPVQSGSDRILKLMNRGYDRKYYLDLIGKCRRIVKNVALSSDLIVGYPTETEEDFKDTYNLLKEARFNSAYIFKYSPRPHTKAAQIEDDVPLKEKQRRHKILLDKQKEISRGLKDEGALRLLRSPE